MSIFKRCPACGQVIRGEIPDDPLADAVLHILDHNDGHYVKARVIQDMVGMDISQPTLWRRLNALEQKGDIERHPNHPKSGWRKVRQKADEMAA